PHDAGVASATINTGQQLGGSIGTSLLNTIFASTVASYIAAHLSPATVAHGRPSPQLTGLALIHGYTTAFWWSAAILTCGAIVALTLFRNGPLTQPGQPQPAGPAHATGTSSAAGQDPARPPSPERSIPPAPPPTPGPGKAASRSCQAARCRAGHHIQGCARTNDLRAARTRQVQLSATPTRQSAGLVQMEAPQGPTGLRRNDLDEIFRPGTADAAASWPADARWIGASSASGPLRAKVPAKASRPRRSR